MEVILLERVEKLGNVGDVVRVKNGYARNFLIPHKKCLRATNENKELFEAQKKSIEAENDKKRKEAEKVAASLDNSFIVLIQQAGEDGRLYGSVTTRDIAKSISNEDLEVKRNQVSLPDAIKYLGVYPVKVAVHPEVAIIININVARSKTEAKEAEKEFLNPAKKDEEQSKEEEQATEVKEDPKEEAKTEEEAK